ncbi:auxin-responsive protein SAUR32 [Carya illinoinensis]|uniref:auxin-responsive protein SAUR32 n=1 Tax=Carya illinoinensis TaxID=32201 RepID=UPI001C71F897|nr:auxin-responsive protein SAUR32 [Carya illinoinensis]
MGIGVDRNQPNFHVHMPHLQFHHYHHHLHQQLHEKKELKEIPKGCLAIKVGQGEEQERFVIPVIYINHPLFMQLLKEAEEEFGFDQKGPITIPCQVEEFRTVQGMIDGEKWHHQHHQHHHHHHVWCFRV